MRVLGVTASRADPSAAPVIDGAFLATTDLGSQLLPAPIVRRGDSSDAGDRFAAAVAAFRIAVGVLTSEAADRARVLKPSTVSMRW